VQAPCHGSGTADSSFTFGDNTEIHPEAEHAVRLSQQHDHTDPVVKHRLLKRAREGIQPTRVERFGDVQTYRGSHQVRAYWRSKLSAPHKIR
jgi:hypothetical protein